jgi:hypothetical protein
MPSGKGKGKGDEETLLCSQCGRRASQEWANTTEGSCYYMGLWVCCVQCRRNAGDESGWNVDSDTGEAIDSEDEERIEFTVTRNENVVYQGTDYDALEEVLQHGDVVDLADGQRIIFNGTRDGPPYIRVEGKGKGKGKGFSPFSGKGHHLSD